MLVESIESNRPKLVKFIGIAAYVILIYSAILLLQKYLFWGFGCFSLAIGLGLVFEACWAQNRKYRKRCILGAVGFGLASLYFFPIIIF